MPIAAAGNMFEYRDESPRPERLPLPPIIDGLALPWPPLPEFILCDDVLVMGGDIDMPRSSSSFIIVAGARPGREGETERKEMGYIKISICTNGYGICMWGHIKTERNRRCATTHIHPCRGVIIIIFNAKMFCYYYRQNNGG